MEARENLKSKLLLFVGGLLGVSLIFGYYQNRYNKQEIAEVHRTADSIEKAKNDTIMFLMNRLDLQDSIIKTKTNDTVQNNKKIKHLDKVVEIQVYTIDSVKHNSISKLKSAITKGRHVKLDRNNSLSK